MNSIIGILVVILTILLLDKAYKWLGNRREKTRIELDVLKVVSKHECFGLFKNDPTQFEKWIAKFLALKGYKNVEVTSANKDGGKDLIYQDKQGNIVYVECKLYNPENWDTTVDRTVAQKLVGAMVGDGVKKGLIITTATLSDDAKAYLKQVQSFGLDIKYIDGDALVKELYELREVKLPEIIERLSMKFIK